MQAETRATDPALERLRQAVAADPRDRVGWHNLAAAEGDRGNAAQAEGAARRAIALGIAAPETRLVLARALQDQHRLDEAERAFEEALEKKFAYLFEQLRVSGTRGLVEQHVHSVPVHRPAPPAAAALFASGTAAPQPTGR